MYDVAIIGAGAAGISAALTLSALKKNIIWFGSRSFSEKIRKAELIRNYPGLDSVSGEEMARIFAEQTANMDIEITQKQVTGVYPLGDHFGILCNTDMYDARAVILATGVDAVKPIPGELEFMGRGVSFCATCDGNLYKGKTVAVISTSKEYEHEVEYLAGLAEKLYFVPLYQSSLSLDEALNVETITERPRAVEGDMKARRLKFDGKDLEIDGVFFLKAAVSPAALVTGLATEDGHIPVDRACRTNIEGCFAAGDCTGTPYQYAKAVGEGNVAAHSAVKYLAKK